LVKAGVETVMGAYNRTLDEPCCASNLLLKEILRDSWGFKGHVVSDCWAIQDFHLHHKITQSPEESAALALNAGCDLNCGCTYPMLTVAHKKGLVTEEAINTALERLLRTRFKLGMFDPPGKGKYDKLGRKIINCEKHKKLALKAAHKSIVLLKNDNNLLPLDSNPRRIDVAGPGAANAHTLFGNYYGVSSRFTTILEGLAEKVKDKFGIQLEYRQGCLMHSEGSKNICFGSSNTGSVQFIEVHPRDLFIAVMGLDGAIEGEEGDAIASDSNGDRNTIELPSWQLNYLRKIRSEGKRIILVLTGGSPIAFPEDIADAIIFAWYPGESGGQAVADIIFGDVIPSGKLPVTFPVSTDQLPPFDNYSMKGRTYRYMTEKPLYPFGFGLSYTSFQFDSITLDAPLIKNGNKITASVTISNTGKYDADDVVQIYISKDGRSDNDPIASLKDFRRVFIKAGKSVKVNFELPSLVFETVNAEGKYELLPGSYTVIAADAAPVLVAAEKGAPKPVSAKIKVE
jgi:beta-glucosidase